MLYPTIEAPDMMRLETCGSKRSRLKGVVSVSLFALCACGGESGEMPDAGVVSIDANIVAVDGGAGYGHVLYLNFAGGALDWGAFDDAPSRVSALVSGPKNVPAVFDDFLQDATHSNRALALDAVTTLVRGALAPYDVQIVTQRPASAPFTMIVVGGTLADSINENCDGVLGRALLDCDDTNPGNVGFAASDCPNSRVFGDAAAARQLMARTILHEAGHTFGLGHLAGDSIMSAQPTANALTWGVGAPLADGTSCGRAQQDDDAILREHLGDHLDRADVPVPPDQTPPMISHTVPADGSLIPTSFQPCVTADDSSELQVAILQLWVEIPGVGLERMGTWSVRDRPFQFPVHSVAWDPSIRLLFRFLVLDQWDNLAETRAWVNMSSSAPTLPPCPSAAAAIDTAQ